MGTKGQMLSLGWPVGMALPLCIQPEPPCRWGCAGASGGLSSTRALRSGPLLPRKAPSPLCVGVGTANSFSVTRGLFRRTWDKRETFL